MFIERARIRLVALCLCVMGLLAGIAHGQTSPDDIVLYAKRAERLVGAWKVEADSTAAGGARVRNPNANVPKINTPSANPSDYFEISFHAQAGRAYRLWMRGKAENNYWGNDSVFIQFSDSVTAAGAATFRIGTTSATIVNLEDATDAGVRGWMWQDNGWGPGALGPVIYFANTGTHTLRVQPREDGIMIDQIVLSPSTYLTRSPGSLFDDTTILPESNPPQSVGSASEIVIWASQITTLAGNWTKAADSTAAGQTVVRSANAGVPKLSAPLANPTNYFQVTFNAEAGRPYRLWMRGKALNNDWANDSVFIQFSGSVNATGAAVFRIGTTSATIFNLEQCSGCGLSGWGWEDNGWGVGVMGPVIYFQTTGPQTMRVQTREDGLAIDQIVLSSQTYLNASPGAFKNDTKILQPTQGSAPTPPANQPPTVTITASPSTGVAPLTVNFTSNASDPDGVIASYSWNFGDGQTATTANPSHVYSSPGTYTARLTVTDNHGATASVTRNITVNTPPSPTGSVSVKVLSWNVAQGRGTDNVYNVDRIATWIANMNPDIIGLCEVMRSGSGDMVIQLSDMLRQKTGRTYYMHFVPKYAGCPEGNLIISKYPLQSTGHRYLSYQRSVAQATIVINGKTINFFATHLDASGSTGAYRTTQMNELKSYMSGFSETRIVVGDFNAWPGAGEMSNMYSSYYDSWATAASLGLNTSYPDNLEGRTRKTRIDYIFYSRGANVSTKAAQVPDIRNLSQTNVAIKLGTLDDKGVRPSDHNLVTAVLEVR